MKRIVQFSCLIALCLGVFITSTAFKADGKMKTITLINKCTFAINEIYLSPVEEKEWGSDILDKDEVLMPGASVEIEIECGKWDTKLVAEDGSTCEVPGVDVCSADIWEVNADCNGE